MGNNKLPSDRFAVGSGCYVGDGIYDCGILQHSYPITRGFVTNWDDMEKIWHYAIHNELRIDPTEHVVLLTEPFNNPKPNREKMIQIMFESFEFPAAYFALQSALALYAYCCYTCVVADSGDGITQIIPFQDGIPIYFAATRLKIAGCDLTKYLMKLLIIGYDCSTVAESRIARNIKEKLCYVAPDFHEIPQEQRYELPDGQIITIGKERTLCPEAFFQPWLLGMGEPGIVQAINDAIKNCDFDLQRMLYRNIVLSGGNTMFQGFSNRLSKELTLLAPQNANVRIHASADRKDAVWAGASYFSTLSTFEQIVISKEEYEESGPKIVNKKCPASPTDMLYH